MSTMSLLRLLLRKAALHLMCCVTVLGTMPLLLGGLRYTPRKLGSQGHRLASRFDHRMDPVTTVVDLRMDGTQCRAITCRV